MAAHPMTEAEPPASPDDQEGADIQEMLNEMGEKHWQAWLDMSVPALKDQTPREAAKTETGRERLEALLWDFEEKGKALQSFTPDLKALRQELGLD
jgi:hypothetical protein